jgi:hypothetical protein
VCLAQGSQKFKCSHQFVSSCSCTLHHLLHPILLKPYNRQLTIFLLQISSHHLTQDVLAIAAAREVKAYPFDMMPDDDSPQISSSFPIATPRTPHSPIRAKCLGISISDQCIDHADSLYTYFMDKQLESTHACIAAACVYIAVQANQAGSSCSIDSISQAFDCSVDDITRLKSKLRNSFSNTIPDDLVEIPVFYASVCDFGLSKVCISCQSIIIRGSKTFFPSRLEIQILQTTMRKDPFLTWPLKYLKRGTNPVSFKLERRRLPLPPMLGHQRRPK